MSMIQSKFVTPRGTGVNQPEKTRYWTIRYYNDLTEELPEPGEAWRWEDVELEHKCLCLLKEMNHIEQVAQGHWRTSGKYWKYLQAVHVRREDPGDGSEE